MDPQGDHQNPSYLGGEGTRKGMGERGWGRGFEGEVIKERKGDWRAEGLGKREDGDEE